MVAVMYLVVKWFPRRSFEHLACYSQLSLALFGHRRAADLNFELEEGGKYSAFAPDLPGYASWGDTSDEARLHIREATELWNEFAIADGDPIPTPGSSVKLISIAS